MVSTSLRALAVLLVAVLVSSPVHAGASQRSRQLSHNERVVIEALISRLESMTEAKFVRNGKAYSPAAAGKFLRAKWKDRADSVLTADDFIEKVASRSSTTGRAYVVRYADGRETAVASVLRLELQRIRGDGPS